MDNFQIKVCKVKQSPYLVAVEVLGLTEVHQVFVIHKDLNGKGGPMEIVSLGL